MSTNQVGDVVIFMTAGTAPGSASPNYVWKFWDGSVQASNQNQGTVSKRLNLGGNPAEVGQGAGGSPPYVIPYRCDICDSYGTTVEVVPGTIGVNNPPTIYGAPSVSVDNQAFPFTTQIQVEAYDLEQTAPPPYVHFFWYYGTNPIGGQDVTAAPVDVAGTYYGTLIGSTRKAYANTLTANITTEGTVFTCKMVDNDGGTNLFSVPVDGYDPSAPSFSVAAAQANVTLDAATLPDAVIAPGQVVNFSTFANDPTAGNIIFTWYLYGSNGWTASDIPHLDHGVTTALQVGYQNAYARDISGETGDGIRTAVVTATNASTGKTATSSLDVNLIQNDPPVLTGIRVYSADGLTDLTGVPITLLASPAHTIVRFSGTATDANEDVVVFRWDFTTPATNDDTLGAGPANFTLYGRDAYVDISSWPASSTYTQLGYATPIDKYGADGTPVPIPQVTLN